MAIIKPTAASLLISENCNLRCKYCFELGSHKNKVMSNEVIDKSLDFLFKNAVEENDDQVSIILFGGEPLTNPKGCERVFEYGHELSQRFGKGFSVNTITNGTIMNEQIFNMYSKYKNLVDINVQVSVDGIKEAHDMNRVTVDGRGSFDMIERNIPKWKQIFMEEDGQIHRLCIHACLSPTNMKYFYESYSYFKNVWKTPFIWFMPIHNATYTKEHLVMYREGLQRIAEELLEETIRTGDLGRITNYAPLDKSVNEVYRGCFYAPCGAGKNFISITADGLISPCHNIYFRDDDNVTIMGNLDDGIDYMKIKLFNDYTVEDMSCNKENPECDCYGCYRCLADNWEVNGNFFSEIRGERCMMSHIERDIQRWLHKELASRGFIEDLSNNGGRRNG